MVLKRFFYSSIMIPLILLMNQQGYCETVNSSSPPSPSDMATKLDAMSECIASEANQCNLKLDSLKNFFSYLGSCGHLKNYSISYELSKGYIAVAFYTVDGQCHLGYKTEDTAEPKVLDGCSFDASSASNLFNSTFMSSLSNSGSKPPESAVKPALDLLQKCLPPNPTGTLVKSVPLRDSTGNLIPASELKNEIESVQ